MKHTTKKQASRQDATPGFAIRLTDSSDLGLAMLILITEDSQQQPIAVVASLNEAREVAQSDLRARMHRVEAGRDPGHCPFEYAVWARGIDGDYRLAKTFDAISL